MTRSCSENFNGFGPGSNNKIDQMNFQEFLFEMGLCEVLIEAN